MFDDQYLNKVSPPTEYQLRLAKCAEDYHVGCEAYDRRVCTGGIGPGGGVMPASIDQRLLISRHAKDLKAYLQDEYQLDPKDFQRAIFACRLG